MPELKDVNTQESSILVSIIIPSYKKADVLEETLNSVLEQSHENWECIIVDDGSTDLSKEVIDPFLNKDSRFLFYQRQ
jgi:glycosyltransferase involved in cell wall biosynthesis